MAQLGGFRDDFYNPSAVLAQAGLGLRTVANLSATLLTASQLAGAQDQYINISGQTTAQTATTDTAANIVLQLQTVVQGALAALISASGGSQTTPAGNPPPGIPNLFNMAYTLSIVNANASAGTLTLTAGAGVTITGGASPLVVTFGTTAIYVVTVTSPTTVTMTRVQ